LRIVVWVEPKRLRVHTRSADAENEPSRGRLRPLLDLPIELVLAARGEPTDCAALERVLS
jgi:hypothetical protein